MFLQELLCALIALLSVWGAAGLIYAAAMWLIRPKNKSTDVLVLRLCGSAEEEISRVGYALSRLSVSGELKHTVIAAVCDARDEARFCTVEAAFIKEPRVVFCTKERFSAAFFG